MRIRLRNEYGMIKEAKAGFGWTTMFFGFFVALLRGDLKWAMIMFVVNFTLVALFGPVGPLLWLIWGFIYNKAYIRELYEKGYRGLSEDDDRIARSYIA